MTIIKSNTWNIESLYKPSSKIVSAYCKQSSLRVSEQYQKRMGWVWKNAHFITGYSAQKVEPVL